MAADDKVVTLLAWGSGAGVGRWLTDLEAGRCWQKAEVDLNKPTELVGSRGSAWLQGLRPPPGW